ncbi:MAG: helix-turn-helix domain-containing protein [Hyphomicrobium sp.]|uniref:helix-turn-helix domain-containing protein n=1 Tax=Hyphomicrobium sp. TaxID=82 RepID=UPI003D12B028
MSNNRNRKAGAAAAESIALDELHRRSMKRPSYRRAYQALEAEFALAEAFIAARARAGLTQAELAARMGTKQSYVARLEAGRTLPSVRTLEKFARATGTNLKIAFEPRRPAQAAE